MLPSNWRIRQNKKNTKNELKNFCYRKPVKAHQTPKQKQ